jgi:hypothetical protein
MIIKVREKPLYLLKLEAYERRTLQTHPLYPLIQKETFNHNIGFKGEQAVDYYLSFLPQDKYHILNGIRLIDPQGRYFQIDTLIVSLKFFLILEINNIAGDLEFDYKQNQLVRKFEDKVDKMACPITQVKRQTSQLISWLGNHKLPKIPVMYQVVLANNQTRLINGDKQVFDNVIRHSNIPDRVLEYEKSFPNEAISNNELRKLMKVIIKKDTPKMTMSSQLQMINNSEFIKGVFCPHCYQPSMLKRNHPWVCILCQFKSKTEFKPALRDFALIVSDTISNKECRDFLQIDSISVASKLLTSLHLPTHGSTKNRRYLLIKNNKLLI